MKNRTGLAPIIIILIIAAAVLAGGGAYYVSQKGASNALWYSYGNDALGGDSNVQRPFPVSRSTGECADGATPLCAPGTMPVCRDKKWICEKASSTSLITDTSAWQTYRNEQYGFEFKILSNWKVSVSSTKGVRGDTTILDVKNLRKKYTVEDSEFVPVIISTVAVTSNDIGDYLTNENVRALYQGNRMMIGGETAYIVQGALGSVGHDFRVLFHNGRAYEFNTHATLIGSANYYPKVGAVDKEEIDIVFNGIISTFKFISP